MSVIGWSLIVFLFLSVVEVVGRLCVVRCAKLRFVVQTLRAVVLSVNFTCSMYYPLPTVQPRELIQLPPLRILRTAPII
jgi:hypothetical protein